MLGKEEKEGKKGEKDSESIKDNGCFEGVQGEGGGGGGGGGKRRGPRTTIKVSQFSASAE